MINNMTEIKNEELNQVTGGGMFSWMAFSHGHKIKEKTPKPAQEPATPQLHGPTCAPTEDEQPWDPLEALAYGDNML